GRGGWDWARGAVGGGERGGVGDGGCSAGRVAVGNRPRPPATAFLVEYRDGTRGTVLLLNGHVQDFTFAARLRGESRPASCLFVQPGLPGLKAFDCLASVLERFFESGQPPAPIERTLLTSGVLEMAMES